MIALAISAAGALVNILLAVVIAKHVGKKAARNAVEAARAEKGFQWLVDGGTKIQSGSQYVLESIELSGPDDKTKI